MVGKSCSPRPGGLQINQKNKRKPAYSEQNFFFQETFGQHSLTHSAFADKFLIVSLDSIRNVIDTHNYIFQGL